MTPDCLVLVLGPRGKRVETEKNRYGPHGKLVETEKNRYGLFSSFFLSSCLLLYPLSSSYTFPSYLLIPLPASPPCPRAHSAVPVFTFYPSPSTSRSFLPVPHSRTWIGHASPEAWRLTRVLLGASGPRLCNGPPPFWFPTSVRSSEERLRRLPRQRPP
ncbi:hypothetical protein NDU88_004707 [Pleurodeles waltl]|uniref:Uncharacterized protein n=1 Tax=Pleurodeles waltl TaxID=8319 RepID=A0AAV7LRS1_PLEWA|nr:hypothetical protein NDU88_004707 [Pleurodeles waltl]